MRDEYYRKMARRLLTQAGGREALKQYGIDVELTDEKTLAETPTVAILVPTYRAPEPRMSDSLRAMVEYTRSKNIIVYSGPPIQSSVVHWSRNTMVTELLKSGKPWTHILMVDDDMVVPHDGLVKLLAHQKDIIGGVCTVRQDPPLPVLRHLDMETGTFERIFDWPDGETFELGGVGAAFTLYSRTAMEQVAQAYFDCLWEKDFYGVSEVWVESNKKKRLAFFDKEAKAFWFRFLPAADLPIEMGEDMSFCYVAKKFCDLSVWCDSSVKPGHLGLYPYTIDDYLPYKEKLAGTRATVKGCEKPLIAITSCLKYRHYDQYVRDTWVKDIPKHATYRFFLGANAEQPKYDEVFLECGDEYKDGTAKTISIMRWALEHGHDCVYKVDNDTLVRPAEMLASNFSEYEYTGGRNAGFASGGSGYWLLKRPMELIAAQPLTSPFPDDVWVAEYLESQNIWLHADPRYKWQPGSELDSKTLAFHATSCLKMDSAGWKHGKAYDPAIMLELYAQEAIA